MRNPQKFINFFAATALLFCATALVLINARQAGAEPQATCQQFAGCSH
jgi:hypothetical protein